MVCDQTDGNIVLMMYPIRFAGNPAYQVTKGTDGIYIENGIYVLDNNRQTLEKDNFETVTVTAKVARKDAEGKRVKEVVDGKKKTVYDEVEKQITKDAPSRLHARRQMMKVFYPVKEVPAKGAGKKKNTKDVDMVKKMFEEIAPKYANRNGGYTRIVKIGQRKGDGAMEVLIELV